MMLTFRQEDIKEGDINNEFFVTHEIHNNPVLNQLCLKQIEAFKKAEIEQKTILQKRYSSSLQ
jgi:hypothetical protein